LNRRRFLHRAGASIAVAAIGKSLHAKPPLPNCCDVAWLKEVVSPPGDLPQEQLTPLFTDGVGRAIDSLRGWESQRRSIREAWFEFLGPMPTERPPTKLEVLRQDDTPHFTRQLVRYECEPGIWVEAYLIITRRAKTERLPGLVVLHSTSPNTIEQTAGLADAPSHHLGPVLCEAGFVALCPRCFLWQDAATYDEAVAKFRERHPRTLGMHKMLHDAMRAVDVLQSLPQVDPQRIGAVGHSLGAKEAFYLTAFDERVKSAVASEGGIGLRSTNWNAPWYLGSAIDDPSFSLNHHQLLALITPRPFLVIAGESGPGAADGKRSWPLVAAAQPASRFYDQPVRIGIYNHGLGHTLTPEIHQRMIEWLQAYV
jgi:dienelactone hydrolase